MGGVATALMLVPDHGIAVVALCNAGHTNLPHCVAEQILSALLPEAGLRPTSMPPPPLPPAQRRAAPEHTAPVTSVAPAFTEKPAWLVGEWTGALRQVAGRPDPLVLAMACDRAGRVFVRLGAEPWTLLDRAATDDAGWLRGVFRGNIMTADANRTHYNLHLAVRRWEEAQDAGSSPAVLCGSLVAVTEMLPGEWRAGNALAEFVALRKSSS